MSVRIPPPQKIREMIAQLREMEVALFNRQAAESERISIKQLKLQELDTILYNAQRDIFYLTKLSQQLGRPITYDYVLRRRREIENELRQELQTYENLANERRRVAEEIYRLSQLLVVREPAVIPQEQRIIQPGQPIGMERDIIINRLLTDLKRLQEDLATAQPQYKQGILKQIQEIRRRLRELGYEY
jgi:hypothetical protein